MEENNLNSNNQMNTNNNTEQQIQPSKSNNKMLIVLMVLIIVGLAGYIIYSKFIQKNDNPKPNDTEEQNIIIADNIYGTYYNSEYSEIYFTLKENNTAVVQGESCGDTPIPVKTVAYKITKSNGKLLLAIDINENQQFEDTYTGEKYNDGYRFKPDSLGCTESESTYYVREDVILDIYGTYYNSEYSEIYFTLKENNTAVVQGESCGDTPIPVKTVAYKITKSSGKLLLAIDINENQQFEDTYTGEKYNDGYRFKPDSLGCTESESTYYVKK